MKGPLTIALGLALATWVGARLVDDGAGGPTATDHLRPLVEPERRAELEVAAVGLEGLGLPEETIYLREGETWSSPTVYGAVALTPEVSSLIDRVTRAWAQEVAPPERAAAYGLDPEAPLRLRLFGPGFADLPGRDLLLELELGTPLPGLGEGRCFARLGGAGPVLELDQNPHILLEPGAGGRLPPMLDERLLAGEWPSRGQGISRAFVDYPDGRSLDVQSRAAGPPPEPGAPSPREWLAVEGDTRARCLPFRIAAWQSFMYKLAYRGLSDPAAAVRRGLDAPQATLTLIQVAGDPIELVVGRSAPSGATFVLNKKTNLLCLLDRKEVELLLATVEMLCAPDRTNPWEQWLPK